MKDLTIEGKGKEQKKMGNKKEGMQNGCGGGEGGKSTVFNRRLGAFAIDKTSPSFENDSISRLVKAPDRKPRP